MDSKISHLWQPTCTKEKISIGLRVTWERHHHPRSLLLCVHILSILHHPISADPLQISQIKQPTKPQPSLRFSSSSILVQHQLLFKQHGDHELQMQTSSQLDIPTSILIDDARKRNILKIGGIYGLPIGEKYGASSIGGEENKSKGKGVDDSSSNSCKGVSNSANQPSLNTRT
ncbi:unnamed protein product [Vicia faba]|uniref:Uncharacterized protein n=1 Tax=Vicia faba TaxID=3906 RepID=A0AAV0YDL9_VICFA|nr:unnamed protein product [Vicia faba]